MNNFQAGKTFADKKNDLTRLLVLINVFKKDSVGLDYYILCPSYYAYCMFNCKTTHLNAQYV